MTQFSFEWILSLNWLCQKWGQVHPPRDYIKEPKLDGYRSVHLLYKYKGNHVPALSGRRIEIQVRSRLQHAWATAVEMLLTFADIPIRESVVARDALRMRRPGELNDWRRFFALMSTVIAVREKQPAVPNTPTDKSALVAELNRLADSLNAHQLFSTWSTFRAPNEVVTGANIFLLKLDPNNRSTSVTGFNPDESHLAFEAYFKAEGGRDWPTSNVVLVTVDSLESLVQSYPNYFGDTLLFVDALQEASVGNFS